VQTIYEEMPFMTFPEMRACQPEKIKKTRAGS
jgi:hypothetical protein